MTKTCLISCAYVFLLTCGVNVQFEGSNHDNDGDNNKLDENEVSVIEETEMDDSIQRINY